MKWNGLQIMGKNKRTRYINIMLERIPFYNIFHFIWMKEHNGNEHSFVVLPIFLSSIQPVLFIYLKSLILTEFSCMQSPISNSLILNQIPHTHIPYIVFPFLPFIAS